MAYLDSGSSGIRNISGVGESVPNIGSSGNGSGNSGGSGNV